MPHTSVEALQRRSLFPSLRALLLFVRVSVVSFWRVVFRRMFLGRRHPLWSFRKELVAEIGRNTTIKLLNVSPAVLREHLMTAPIPLGVRRSVRHERGRHGAHYAEMFTPRDLAPCAPTLLYFHGGGYIAGSPATHRDLIARIARATGARCICIDYRKAPEFPYPAPIDDGEAAYRALLDSGTPPERIVLAGDSAGGGMALAVMLRAKQQKLPMPRCAVLLSPWVDLTRQGASVMENARYDYLTPESLGYGVAHYLQGHDAAAPEVSPLTADLSGLPPLLVQTGDAELFFSENVAFVARARALGVEVTHQVEPGMVHAFQLFASFAPECGPAIDRIGLYLRALSNRTESVDARAPSLQQAS